MRLEEGPLWLYERRLSCKQINCIGIIFGVVKIDGSCCTFPSEILHLRSVFGFQIKDTRFWFLCPFIVLYIVAMYFYSVAIWFICSNGEKSPVWLEEELREYTYTHSHAIFFPQMQNFQIQTLLELDPIDSSSKL